MQRVHLIRYFCNCDDKDSRILEECHSIFINTSDCSIKVSDYIKLSDMELRKIVVAPDSFKGCLSAREIAALCETAIKDELPTAETAVCPLADGGEGTVEALEDSFDGIPRTVSVKGPLSGHVDARYLISKDHKVAVMEMAQCAGLCLIGREDRNPMLTSTFGVGEMILDAVSKGCEKIYMGIGGSATNDGGMGMLTALGAEFLDNAGNRLSGIGADLGSVSRIDLSGISEKIRNVEYVVACDVDNPLVGERGASAVFAPQKGADPDMVASLERGMVNYASVIKKEFGKDVAARPGAGAAGGLGCAFSVFLDAELRSGIEMVLDAVDFDDRLDGADLVITGEGSIDRQSLMGKVPSGVLKRASARGVPVVAIAGIVKDYEELNKSGFTCVFPIAGGPETLEKAMERTQASENVVRTVRQIIRLAMVR